MELIDFINQEKINKKINHKKVISYYNKCLVKTLVELDKKFNKLKNKTNSVISGINMVYNIFFILIFYTNNIKLTIFLVERSILLYSEFIIMSQDKSVIDEICFIPNITDAISFSYKKTIGPLKISNLNLKFDISNINEIFIIIKQILVSDYLNKKETNDFTIIESLLSKIFKLIEKQHYVLVYKHVNNLLNNNKNIVDELQDLHNFLNKNPDIKSYLTNYQLLITNYELPIR